MKTPTDKTTASATPEVYASQDVPGNFGFIGCDSDQYQTLEAAEAAAKRTIPAEKPIECSGHVHLLLEGDAEKPPAKLRNVIVYLEGGVVQDVTVPAGVEVTVIDQDEIECGEQGTFTYEGEAEVNHATQLAEALRDCQTQFGSLGYSQPAKHATKRFLAINEISRQALAAYESEVQQ